MKKFLDWDVVVGRPRCGYDAGEIIELAKLTGDAEGVYLGVESGWAYDENEIEFMEGSLLECMLNKVLEKHSKYEIIEMLNKLA